MSNIALDSPDLTEPPARSRRRRSLCPATIRPTESLTDRLLATPTKDRPTGSRPKARGSLWAGLPTRTASAPLVTTCPSHLPCRRRSPACCLLCPSWSSSRTSRPTNPPPPTKHCRAGSMGIITKPWRIIYLSHPYLFCLLTLWINIRICNRNVVSFVVFYFT